MGSARYLSVAIRRAECACASMCFEKAFAECAALRVRVDLSFDFDCVFDCLAVMVCGYEFECWPRIRS